MEPPATPRRTKYLQQSVSSLFYMHGLFVSSHPVAIIALVIGIALLCCYPLTKLPLLSNAPQEFSTPTLGYTLPPSADQLHTSGSPPASVSSSGAASMDDDLIIPRWYFGAPVAYVQQIIVKSVVSPWEHKQLIFSDAFRAPINSAFDLMEHLNNFQYIENTTSTSDKSATIRVVSLSDVCVHAPGLVNKPQLQGVLPEYNCLVLSPVNLWSKDRMSFADDPEIQKTIFKKFEKGLETPPSIRELLFGMPMVSTGIYSYSFRNRQRTVSFAVTILMKEYNEGYVAALRRHLHELYPLSASTNDSRIDHIVHIHSKELNYVVEYTPLIVTYIVLFAYLYFSVRKIEMVKSKWGLALSAVATVLASLVMSVGLCAFFGLTPSLSGGEIFPYLVVIVGLENVLVVTKSVVSTPVHLDVKLRVAKGISKEGWYIFKNLIAELFIIMFGFFTTVPAIQEFCLFAVVGLLTDFFLQMFFYTTVLSIDIRRMELSDLHRQNVQEALAEITTESDHQPVVQCPFKALFNQTSTNSHHHHHQQYQASFQRSDSSSGSQSYTYSSLPHNNSTDSLQGLSMNSGGGVGVATNSSVPATALVTGGSDVSPTGGVGATAKPRHVPRRLRLFNFIARMRLAQRGLMAFTLIWIGLVLYKAGILMDFTHPGSQSIGSSHHTTLSPTIERLVSRDSSHGTHDSSASVGAGVDSTAGDVDLVKYSNLENWRSLTHHHWATLLDNYNLSLKSRYISILPSVHLSHIISAEDAIRLRHPEESARAGHGDVDMDGGDDAIRNMFIQQQQKQHQQQQQAQSEVGGWSEPATAHHNDHHDYDSQRSQMSAHLNFTVIISRVIQYPQSASDWVWLMFFVVATGILCGYLMYYLYRCLCTRNYAQWRTNTSRRSTKNKRYNSGSNNTSTTGKVHKGHRRQGSNYFKQIRESLPLNLKGHLQTVECMITDGSLIVSSCLGGQIFVWDSMTGERVTSIKRERTPSSTPHSPLSVRSMLSDEQIRASRDQAQELYDLSEGGINQKKEFELHHRRPKSVDYSKIAPNLTSTIFTDFTKSDAHRRNGQLDIDGLAKSLKEEYIGKQISADEQQAAQERSLSESDGYDFDSLFGSYYHEHELDVKDHSSISNRHSQESLDKDRTHSLGSTDSIGSAGSGYMNQSGRRTDTGSVGREQPDDFAAAAHSPIWSLDCKDNLVIAGTGNGRVELYDTISGNLKGTYHENMEGVAGLCLLRNKLVVARINGYLDFLELESYPHLPRDAPIRRNFSFGRSDSSSGGGMGGAADKWPDTIYCSLLSSTRAHQQAITAVKHEAGRLVTGSQDHTLKVFRMDDLVCLYTLHGHKGGITTLFLDNVAPLQATSGSEDGSVRLWDLLTGVCIHKFEGHGDGAAVTSLLCTSVYVISSGTDDRLYVWERIRGNLLHWIQMNPGFCYCMAMLTSHLMVSGGQGCLYLWDISKGQILRAVPLGGDHRDAVSINDIRIINNTTVVCDYGRQLRVIHFPSVLEKAD